MGDDEKSSVSSAEYEAIDTQKLNIRHKGSVESLDSVQTEDDKDDVENYEVGEEWREDEEQVVEEEEEESHPYYPELPLPPLPPPTIDIPPELPVRGNLPTAGDGDLSTAPLPPLPSGGLLHSKSDDEESASDNNLVTPSTESLNKSVLAKTHSSGKLKRKGRAESEFMNDDTAILCGILHKRKILAVWQKHYCKVKNEMLMCWRNLDNAEPSFQIKLRQFHLDRADETYKNFAFKLYNDERRLYFAAENRADLMEWLSAVAKGMNKERFVALKDPDNFGHIDYSDGRGRVATIRPESTGSESSLTNISSTQHRDGLADHTSDFDADNESGESEHSEKKLSITDPLPPGEQRPQIQGYLFRKQAHHWTRRWCCVKGAKLFVYRQGGRELPELVILMEFAALTVPADHGTSASAGLFPFKITYESQQHLLLATKSKADWISWTTCIEEHIGSTSEEPFPYINVPSTSSGGSFHQQHSTVQFMSNEELDVAGDEMLYEPVAASPQSRRKSKSFY